jgi:hypothetical protein
MHRSAAIAVILRDVLQPFKRLTLGRINKSTHGLEVQMILMSLCQNESTRDAVERNNAGAKRWKACKSSASFDVAVILFRFHEHLQA